MYILERLSWIKNKLNELENDKESNIVVVLYNILFFISEEHVFLKYVLHYLFLKQHIYRFKSTLDFSSCIEGSSFLAHREYIFWNIYFNRIKDFLSFRNHY